MEVLDRRFRLRIVALDQCGPVRLAAAPVQQALLMQAVYPEEAAQVREARRSPLVAEVLAEVPAVVPVVVLGPDEHLSH